MIFIFIIIIIFAVDYNANSRFSRFQ